MTESTLPFPRRIVTSNLPLEARFVDNPSAEPRVRVTSEEIIPLSLLDGKAARCPIFTHPTLPTNNNELYINPQSPAAPIIDEHQGASIQFNDLAPGGKVPMHRTTSTDYIVFLMGEVVLITPDEGYDPKTGRPRVSEVICRAGDVVMQRGTLHAWENRTKEWVRFLGVGLRAKPTTVEVEGQETQRVLKDCFDV